MNKRKLLRILLLALGALIIVLSVRGLVSLPASGGALEGAVYLEEAVVLPENEGKMVIIHGKVETTAPACDEELGLTLQTVKAYRYDEEYRQTVFDSKEKKWDWVGTGTKTITGSGRIGEFELDEKILTAFPAESYYDDFDPAEIGVYGTDRGNESLGSEKTYVLINADSYYRATEYDREDSRLVRESDLNRGEAREGATASYYRCYDASRYEAMTVAGVQQGNRLLAHGDTGAVVHDGVLAKDALVSSNKAQLVGGSAAFLVLGLLCVFLALRRGKGSGKKNDKGKRG